VGNPLTDLEFPTIDQSTTSGSTLVSLGTGAGTEVAQSPLAAAIEDTANRLEQGFNDVRQGIDDSLNSLGGERADDDAASTDAGDGTDSSAD
jgi:hypothetical protein